MSEAKFTKGEWTAFGNFGYGWGVEIGNKGGFQFHIDMENQQENAHLIAAAPEMYDLLKEFRDFAERQGWKHALIIKADELLAKARGEK